MKYLDVDKAVGPDCISPRILHDCYLELSYPITMLFHRICKSGTFPMSWKVPRVTPVFKNRGSVSDPLFYRPVSVMPTLALLFECVIGSQMYNFIAPFIPQNQYGFVKGTGAQDCGATIAFTATQALNRRQECRIVSLDIKGAFDRIWWNGLLNHLCSIGFHQRAYSLMESYLSDRYLFVVANGQDSSLYPITAGIPQGGVWSPMLFNLYVHHLPSQLKSCLMVSYADDSTLLKAIPTKDLRLSAAAEINADLCSIADWGRRWHIEFEPLKSSAICVSLKRDVEEHPPLFMNGVLIKESKVLSILGFHFDSHLTWGYMIDTTVQRCRQRLGCLRRVSEYLGTEGLSLAYRAFVCPVAEYGGILLLGASATQLAKLDCMQQFAEQLCSSSFVPLSRRRHAAALGLLCKLLDGTCREHLHMFCPAFLSSVSLPRRSQRLNLPRPYLLINPITAASLDLLRRSFLGCIADIWNDV